MEGIIASKLPKIMNFIFEIFFLSNEKVKSNKRNKNLFFIILISLNFFELLKNLFNGFANSNLCRLYLFDFIVSFGSYQIVFDFSFAITYIYMIRLSFKVILNFDQTNLFDYKYFKFLELQTEADLMRKQRFGKKECREYFKLVNFTISFFKYNTIVFFFGVALNFIRMFYVSYTTLPLKSFWLISLPNAFSIGCTAVLNFLICGCFYLIFWLDCIFLNKKLKSLTRKTINFESNKRSNFKNSLQNLIVLNEVLTQFHLRQKKDYNLTIATNFVGMTIVGFTFPFTFFFSRDDFISYVFTVTLYVQGLLYAIYSIIAASSFLNNGVNILFSSFLI